MRSKEFLGWAIEKPKDSGLYWWKPSVSCEDWKAIKVFGNEKDSGVWKPCSIKL